MKKLLIADDDFLVRSAYRDIFEDIGCHVEVFDNGLAALEHCRREMPDFIILDIHMPELNGLDTCREIRKLKGGDKIPILIISGSIGKSQADTIKCGASRFVHKPIDTDNLVAIVSEMSGSN